MWSGSSSQDPLIFFLCLLAVLCQVFVAVVLVMNSLGAVSPAWRVRRRSVLRALEPVAAQFAFCVALVTMLGSLYLSEVKHYEPCHLCWVQRTLLYPQVAFTALLAFRPGLTWVRRLAAGMLLIDIPISIYHYVIQLRPDLETSSCSFNNPCTQRFIDRFGYLSEPFLALTAAATILALLMIQKKLPSVEIAAWLFTSAIVLCVVLFQGHHHMAGRCVADFPLADHYICRVDPPRKILKWQSHASPKLNKSASIR